uniref:ATP synthase complex subunit 8 n=1 Tax=Melyridae sp. GENSP01 TaxID=1205563 RepID=A0A0S2MPJ0_9CUCU|nr:ATP synthase F0 subunit 8 [Melyridae sp. GENSP01]
MPQMSPLNWLILFILFSMVFIFVITLNFYNISYLKTYSHKKSPISNNWKW